MGKREREEFRRELEKLGKISGPDETQEFWDQNRKVAEAEQKLSWAENLWVRGQGDDS